MDENVKIAEEVKEDTVMETSVKDEKKKDKKKNLSIKKKKN